VTQSIVNGIIAGTTHALVAIGFGLIYTMARFFHLAHGAVLAASAYVTYVLIVYLAWHPVYAMISGIIFGVVLGVFMEVTIYRPLRSLDSSPSVLFLASLGILVCIQNAISLAFGDQPLAFASGQTEVGVNVLGAYITRVQLMIVCAATIMCSVTAAVMKWTKVGRMMRAVANDRGLAEIVGVKPDRAILIAMALGSAFAAIAGILVALDTDLTPNMGLRAMLMGVTASVVGGIGSIFGNLLGGLFVGMLQHLGIWCVSTQWQDAIVFIALITFLLLRPRGVLGRLRLTTIN
jgi:branched-subunit amino acid ABC-type transport system permease component